MRAGIAGAGIMGRLLGHNLQRANWDITLFDQGSEKSASMCAAGLLTPIAELAKNPLIIYQLGKDAIQSHWPTILAELDTEIYFEQQGSLVLAFPRDYPELAQFSKLITSKLPMESHELQREQIASLEPEITHFQKGYFFAEEAHLDSQGVFKELGERLTIKDSKIENIQEHIKNFDIFFDCRGLGATEHFKDLRSVRGELIWLFAPDVNITRPVRLLHPRYSLYIVPRPGNCYLIGATEIESHDCSEISVRSVLELLTAAYSVHPGFAEARVLQTATQCRPTLIDHLPKIKYADGFIAINGLYRHGYLIAPTLSADIINWLAGGMSTVKYPQLWEAL